MSMVADRRTTLVALDGVHKRYGSGATRVDALRDVDLEIDRGELVVLLGPSGSGKTTLLNVIGGIEPPTSGQVTVAGVDLAGLDDDGRTAYRRDQVGFVFQFFNLVPSLTADENVRLVVELTGRDPDLTGQALDAVGLHDRGRHFPAELSGGEQQRVAIARAIATGPDLLLCDEPTGSLDLETGRQVLDVLQRRNREQHTTTVIVTHNSAIGDMADRVVRMRSGSIVGDRANDDPVAAAEVTW